MTFDRASMGPLDSRLVLTCSGRSPGACANAAREGYLPQNQNELRTNQPETYTGDILDERALPD